MKKRTVLDAQQSAHLNAWLVRFLPAKERATARKQILAVVREYPEYIDETSPPSQWRTWDEIYRQGQMMQNPKLRKKPAKRAKTYITRPSQATRAAPSKRLKARRAKVASGAAPKGYFPNPKKSASSGYRVYFARRGEPFGKYIAQFQKYDDAKEYAQALATKLQRQIVVNRK